MTKSEQLSKTPKRPSARKCLTCRQWFNPLEQGITTCSTDCAIMHGRTNVTKQNAKAQRIARKEFKDNDKPHLIKVAQQVFNKYIRLRDESLPCISCLYEGTSRQWHAGHLKSVGGNGNLRFNEDNVNKQCSICNNHKSGNVGEYEKNLILKIGKDRVYALDTKVPKSYDVKELQNIIETYKLKIKALND